MKEQPLISLCVIACDEAELLTRCLDSASSIADEMIVVDTGSTDATPRIAEHCGARLFRRDWDDDFSAARNAALKRARGRFILVLDADEWIEGGIAPQALRARLEQTDEEAFTVTVHDYLDSGASKRYPLVRLFRNREEHRYEGSFHEQITPSIARRLEVDAIQPIDSELVLGHDGYLHERAVARDKRERNLRMLRCRLDRHPEEATSRYFLIRELIPVRTGRAVPGSHLREALVECKRLDPWRGQLPPALDADFTRLWALALLSCERPDEALRLLVSRGDSSPAFELLRAEAEMATAAGNAERLERAVARVRGCFDREDRGSLPAIEPTLTGPIARTLAARVLHRLSRPAEARMLVEEAMTEPGGGAAPFNVLAAIEREAGSAPATIKAYFQGVEVDPYDPWAWCGLGESILEVGRPQDALEPLSNAAALAPGWERADETLAVAMLACDRVSELGDRFATAAEGGDGIGAGGRAAWYLAQRALGREVSPPAADASRSVTRILERLARCGDSELFDRLVGEAQLLEARG